MKASRNLSFLRFPTEEKEMVLLFLYSVNHRGEKECQFTE